MTTNPPPLPIKDDTLFFDNSFFDWLQTCPRGLEYERLLKRTPATAKTSLLFGSAGHHVLEYRYKTCGNNTIDAFQQGEQLRLLETFFHERFPPLEEGDFRTLNWASELFVQKYNERYQAEPFNLLMDKEGKPMVEVSFVVPFGTRIIDDRLINIFYMGRIDLPVLWDNQVIVFDHKTSSIMGTTVFDELRISPQQIGYAWAFQRLTGRKVAGFCVNVIRSRPPAAKPKNGLAAWWEESFVRDKTYLQPHHFSEWEENTNQLIDECLWYHTDKRFPQKKKWCVGKYGRCAFYDVCALPPESRSLLLESPLFVDNNWSPLQK